MPALGATDTGDITVGNVRRVTYAQANHPQTSHDAADDPEVIETAVKDEARCYALIEEAGEQGCTSDEISTILGASGRIIPPNQIASRIMSLRTKGEVASSGSTRKTRRNRQATVWVLDYLAPKPKPKRRPKVCPTCKQEIKK